MEEGKKKIFTKERVISGVIGLAIGVAVMCIIGWFLGYFASTGMAKLIHGKDTVATVDGKSVSTQTLYDNAKEYYGLSLMIDEVDKIIFDDDKYDLTEREEENVKKQAKVYVKQYGGTEEEFLEAYKFENYEEYLDDIRLSTKFNNYYYDYLESKLEEGAVQKYYDENKADIETYDSEHILVKISSTVTDEQALALANEIIGKLNEGKAFSEVVEEYKDKITYEELGFQGKTSNLQQTYIDELVALKDGEYSKTPIKTTYGYHIVHKLATATIEDLRDTIITTLSTELLQEDSHLRYKIYVELREEKGLKIYDEELNKEYEEYCDTLFGEEHTH